MADTIWANKYAKRPHIGTFNHIEYIVNDFQIHQKSVKLLICIRLFGLMKVLTQQCIEILCGRVPEAAAAAVAAAQYKMWKYGVLCCGQKFADAIIWGQLYVCFKWLRMTHKNMYEI